MAFCFLSIVGFSYITGQVMLGSFVKIMIDSVLTAYQIFAYSFIITSVAPYIQRQIYWNMPQLFLTKCSRTIYTVGTAIGFYLVIILSMIIFYIASSIVLKITTGSYHIYTGYAFICIGMEAFIICSLAFLLSCTFSYPMCLIILLGSYLIAYTYHEWAMNVVKNTNDIFRVLAHVAYYCIPNLNLFDTRTTATYHLPLPSSYYWDALCYTVLYDTFFVTTSVIVIKKKYF